MAVAELPQDIVERVCAYVADLYHISHDSVEVLSIEPRQWRSASLGMHEPGFSFAEAITSGYIINVKAEGHTMTFHTDEHTQFICVAST